MNVKQISVGAGLLTAFYAINGFIYGTVVSIGCMFIRALFNIV